MKTFSKNKLTQIAGTFLIALSLMSGVFVLSGCASPHRQDSEQASSSQPDTSTSQSERELREASASSTATDIPEGTAPETSANLSEAEPSEVVPDAISQRIANMSLDEKICQLLIVTPEVLTGYDVITSTGPVTEEMLDTYPVGGLIYFGQNLETMEQSQAMLSAVNAHQAQTGGIPLFLAVDEEGGDVARCASRLGTTAFSPMFYYHDDGPEVARSNARTIANDISSVGFNLNFAPVADTWSNPENVATSTRAYSDNYDQGAELISAAVEGFHEGGVACTLKHFPGYGEALNDPHYGSIYSARTLEEIREGELKPFVAGIEAGADMIMIGHITMTSLDDGVPATLSRVVITDVLRGELGYQGVVLSDAMNMGSIVNEFSGTEAAVMALEAGVDIVLMPDSVPDTIAAVRQAIDDGRLSEERLDESVRRVLQAKVNRGLLSLS